MTGFRRTRVKVIERLQQGAAAQSRPDSGFPEALREAGQRAARGAPTPPFPITAEMVADPVYGEFWRQMFQARERVRFLRNPGAEPITPKMMEDPAHGEFYRQLSRTQAGARA